MLHKYPSSKLMKTPLIERKNGDKNLKVANNLSPFFLFEAAGDSEGDIDHPHHHHQGMVMMVGLQDDLGYHYDNGDDAQSCSYDNEWDATSHVNDTCRGRSYRTHHVGVHDDDDNDDDERVGIHKYKCTSEVMSTANSHNSRNMSCVDSSEVKKMNEKERSRLFWETCLAS